jgi:hypothetical protein
MQTQLLIGAPKYPELMGQIRRTLSEDFGLSQLGFMSSLQQHPHELIGDLDGRAVTSTLLLVKSVIIATHWILCRIFSFGSLS